MKQVINLVIIFLILVSTVFIKYQFFLHPSKDFYFLSASDIMSKAPEFLRKPVPTPYVDSYIEYPIITGLWASFTGSLSGNAREYFFLNGILLCFFSTLNIILAKSLAKTYFGREISLYSFLTPSVVVFTFFNWEALALFFLLSALYSFGKTKNHSGIFLSTLGFWAKVFPIFCLPAIYLNLMRRKKYVLIASSLAGLIIISLILNLPFYLASHDGWSLFFTFSSKRPPNIDSVWSGIYVVTDKLFGTGFYYKRYYEVLINYVSFGLMLLVGAVYYILKLRRRSEIHVIVDTAFLISIFLILSKVYSPQYNLWIVLLLVVIGVSYKKILLYEMLNVFLTWAVFQYFWQVFIAGRTILPFPFFKLTYLLSVLRHLSLILIAMDLWRISFRRSAINYEKED